MNAAPDTAPPRLRRDDLPADTVALARFLIGCSLVHDLPEGRLRLRIVETEAYPVGDPASHAYRGKTARNRSMYRARGHAYVYIAYGMYPCCNVTSEEEGEGAAVLLRAGEPLEGIAIMRHLRNEAGRGRPGRAEDLARGPGRLAMVMGIGLTQDGVDLCGPGPLWLGAPAGPQAPLAVTPRIGITRAAEHRLRFLESGSRFASGPARLRGLSGTEPKLTRP